jgi:rhamnulokinase
MKVMADLTFCAIDLGAESGRGVLGRLRDDVLSIDEIHRFPNGPLRLRENLHWDVLALQREIERGIGIAVERSLRQLDGVAIDSWGVDFALLGRGDVLLGNPHHYRDPRSEGMMAEAFQRMPKKDIFKLTGIQFMPINTVYQLLSMALERSPVLQAAETFLMIADLFNFFLTGRKGVEYTLATTTQLFDPRRPGWAESLFDRLGIPIDIMPEVIEPASVLGPLEKRIADEVGLPGLRVIAPASHDTASAVVAAPAVGEDWGYISSGTWALVGAEIGEPIISDESMRYGLTNEGGVGGRIRFLRNVAGLWLVQESRRAWARLGEDHTYAELAALAEAAEPFRSIVYPDAENFLKPGDMPRRIQEFCHKSDQRSPLDKGGLIRCILESLALRFRQVFKQIETCLGRRLNVIHIVGGGSQNELLNQMTADACGVPVVAGPAEAASIGNLLMQAVAIGELDGVEGIRRVVARSFNPKKYEPGNSTPWDEAYERFEEIARQDV